MLSSISPLGERARASRWWLTTIAYLFASVLGGVALGAVAGLLGAAVPPAWRAAPITRGLLAAGLLFGVLVDLRARGGAVPSWRRQVDEAWLGRYRGWVYGAGFGLQLGLGLVTIITSCTTYAMATLAVWAGDPVVGALIGGSFGLVRALPALGMAPARTAAALHRRFEVLERAAPAVRWLAMVTMVAAAAALAMISTQGS